ncbi:MAG TPA: IS110 family transposase [Propionibacteriaceae bacterium]|nr:IS110 family transposase [Propionibacteriaceae bacterium]
MSIVSPTVFVGLDYHADSVQVCVLDRQGKQLANRSCRNEWQTVQRVVRQACGKEVQVQAAIESCCGAANLADELIACAKWSVDLAHPGYVARLKQSPDKTDYSDARMLADLERVGYLPRVWLAPEEVRELRRLVRYRQTLVQEQRTLKLRIGAALREARQRAPQTINSWTKAWVTWVQSAAELSPNARLVVERQLARLAALRQEIQEVEALLEEQTKNDPLVQKLRAQPGIGLITAATIRAEIGRFDRFRSGKQLARFCGLSPRNASSGQRQADAGLIKAGNPQLRTVLIEAAHRLMRYDERWLKLNHKLRFRGKPGSVVAAAVANRWVRGLFHQMQPANLAG